MNKENTEYLYNKYHQLFRDKDAPMTHTCLCWGLEVGDGWFDLLKNLCEQIQVRCEQEGYTDIRVIQCKEKYGTLRFYVNHADDFIYDLIEVAQEKSSHVCEVCGSKRGTLRSDHGWLSVRCKKCWTKYNKDADDRLALINGK